MGQEDYGMTKFYGKELYIYVSFSYFGKCRAYYTLWNKEMSISSKSKYPHIIVNEVLRVKNKKQLLAKFKDFSNDS